MFSPFCGELATRYPEWLIAEQFRAQHGLLRWAQIPTSGVSTRVNPASANVNEVCDQSSRSGLELGARRYLVEPVAVEKRVEMARAIKLLARTGSNPDLNEPAIREWSKGPTEPLHV
jgi:hypothetical protein